MKKLTINPAFYEGNFKKIAEKIGVEDLPENFKEVLSRFGGCSIKERYYYDKSLNVTWVLHGFVEYPNLFDFLNHFEEIEVEEKYCIFAFDEGGYRFCISFNENNPVFIFTNEEEFIKIADSFDQFINDLSETQKVI